MARRLLIALVLAYVAFLSRAWITGPVPSWVFQVTACLWLISLVSTPIVVCRVAWKSDAGALFVVLLGLGVLLLSGILFTLSFYYGGRGDAIAGAMFGTSLWLGVLVLELMIPAAVVWPARLIWIAFKAEGQRSHTTLNRAATSQRMSGSN